MKAFEPFSRRLLPVFTALFLLAASGLLGAQAADPAATATAKPAATAAKPASPAITGKTSTAKTDPSAGDAPKVPDTYRTIALGMDIEAVKKELLGDGLFGYRGERDISMLPTMNRTLIESVGDSFIRRSWFQFFEDKLYVMTFNLDPDRMDYYSMYSTLVQKYGEPTSLDPHKAVWSDDKVTLSLERPLTVKYVDMEVFNGLLDKSGADTAMTDLLRENFLNEF